MGLEWKHVSVSWIDFPFSQMSSWIFLSFSVTSFSNLTRWPDNALFISSSGSLSTHLSLYLMKFGQVSPYAMCLHCRDPPKLCGYGTLVWCCVTPNLSSLLSVPRLSATAVMRRVSHSSHPSLSSQYPVDQVYVTAIEIDPRWLG